MIIRYTIYSLIDPRTNEEFYVGITRDPLRERLYGHISNAKHRKKYRSGEFIGAMLIEGVTPIIKEIDFVEFDSDSKEYNRMRQSAHDRERHWIREYLRLGKPLVNELWVVKSA